MATRKLPSHLNFVHNDEIWKDHVRHELHSLRQWPKKWGYLTKEYSNLNKQLIGEPITPKSARSKRGSAVASSRKSTSKSEDRLPDIAPSSQEKSGSTAISSPVARSRKPVLRRRMGSHGLTKLPAIRSDSTPDPSTFMGGVAPIPPKFPRTTAEEVGWKSALRENQMEVYGRYAPNARGQHGILKLLEWPQQGL